MNCNTLPLKWKCGIQVWTNNPWKMRGFHPVENHSFQVAILFQLWLKEQLQHIKIQWTCHCAFCKKKNGTYAVDSNHRLIFGVSRSLWRMSLDFSFAHTLQLCWLTTRHMWKVASSLKLLLLGFTTHRRSSASFPTLSVKRPTNFVQRLYFRLEVLLRGLYLRHGTHGFTSLPKEVILRIFTLWKNPSTPAGIIITKELMFQ